MGVSDVERLASIYREVTGTPQSPKLIQNLERLADLSTLVGCDESVLRRAAASLQGGPGWGFPVAEWGRATRRTHGRESAGTGSAQTELISGLAPASPRDLRRTLEEVGTYIDESLQRLTGRYSPELLAEARTRLLSRALTGNFREGALVRRSSRWKRVPTGPVGLPPVIDADDAEEVLVHLLALTWPEAQFSYRPSWSGDVFAGWNSGYHRSDAQRVYVTGLSDILDSVREVVQDHRDGQGGRIYVRDGRVACADCRKVIAWIESAKNDQPVPPAHLRDRRSIR